MSVLCQESFQTYSSFFPFSFPICHRNPVHAYSVRINLGGFWKSGVNSSLFMTPPLKTHHLPIGHLSQFSSFCFNRHLLRHSSPVCHLRFFSYRHFILGIIWNILR